MTNIFGITTAYTSPAGLSTADKALRGDAEVLEQGA